MPDVWSQVADIDAATQERLADVLETRGADAQQQAMRRAFLADIEFPAGARVLEVGCGTGVLTRLLARWPRVVTVAGVDPAGPLLNRARRLAAELANVTFHEADGRAVPFDGETFDVVVLDSALSHIPDPDAVLAEARRVLRPGGWLAIFDGDYATTTVALGDHDPLQACAAITMAGSVHDRWLIRRLPMLVRRSGFDAVRLRSHGFVETTEGGYALTIIDRGVDILHGSGQIGEELAAALRAEARRRVAAGTFFGHVAYGSLTARRGATRTE